MLIWFAFGLFLVLLFLTVRSLLTRRKRRRDFYSKLTPEQKRARAAQTVAWYFNLPEDQQTKETWDLVISDGERE